MNTSTVNFNTPTRDDLRRKTLIVNLKKNMECETPPTPLRRRTAVLAVNNTANSLQISNDEHERSSRRSLATIRKSIGNLPRSGQTSYQEPTKFTGEQEVKDHFQICTKLYSENKINARNAWQLHIIDLLKHMSQKTNTETLQVAGTSLDISAKVYGIRVDDIHADGLKLASGITRVADRPKDTEEGVGLDREWDENVDNQSKAPKRKKKNRRMLTGDKNTISKDPKSLKAPLPKLESVFFSTRINTEASAVDNLFTNVLKMDHSSYKFVLLSKDNYWPNQPDPILTSAKDPNRKKFELKVQPVSNLKLCVPFRDFYVDEWDPEEEDKLIAEKSILTQQQDVVIYDENGIPIPDLDGSIPNVFADDNADFQDNDAMDADQENCTNIEENVVLPQIRNDIEHIVDFRPDENRSLQRSEYSYNSVVSTHSGQFLDQIWAGPSHWKLKFIKRASERYSGRVTEKPVVVRQTRKRAEAESINFDDLKDHFDVTKKLKKKTTHLVEAHKITLPMLDAAHVDWMDHIRDLVLRPGFCPVRKKPAEEENVEYEVENYKYDNPNDENYCSMHHDDNDAMSHNEDEVHEEVIMAQQNFLQENLVDAPELVPPSYIPYAFKAKKMDMKKLKTAIWDSLTVDEKVTKATAFTDVYSGLPDRLPEKMKSELSCHLTFLALLHLCNEKNLKLVQHGSLNDFDIMST